MSNEAVDAIKAKLLLVEYLPAHGVPLQKDGATLKANCPFHADRTPSFIVDPKINTWSCFGACQAKRQDVISFFMKQRGLEFKKALELLATEAGVSLPRKREKPKGKVVATYDYRDEAGSLLFQALRYEPKGFSQGYYNMEERLVPMIQRVGDAAAGLGRESFPVIVRALGQMQSAVKVNARDMLQLTEAGIPAWKMLADAMKLPTAAVQKMVEAGAHSIGPGIPFSD